MPEHADGATQTGPAEIHRRLVESYDEVLAGRLEEALTLIDPDVIDHRGGLDGDHHGLDAWRRKWERAGGNGFHDVSVTIEHNVESGDTSVNRYTSRGTHTATGRHYEVLGMDMVRVRNGKLVEHWALRDQAALVGQLGLDKDG
jgi:ketosteroid isomerase-like protein